mmetsp:Transcript_35612/g.40445  ORF Transcript_35612/g.40445 Transcript_35612/m.40445 type:complete len:235 (+) Transcript_35612:143-847(+)
MDQQNRIVITTQDISEFQKLLKTLENDEDAYEFRQPVDFKGLGLTDYPKIIRHPIDLSSVKKKLKTGKYSYHDEIISDVQLIWENCKTYNMANSFIYLQAEKMEKLTKKQLGIMKLGVPRAISEEKKEDGNAEGDNPEEENNEEDEDVITIGDKIRLAEYIKDLDYSSLHGLVSLLHSEARGSVENVEGNKLQLRVDNLDADTFRRAEEYVMKQLDIAAPEIVDLQSSKRQKTR